MGPKGAKKWLKFFPKWLKSGLIIFDDKKVAQLKVFNGFNAMQSIQSSEKHNERVKPNFITYKTKISE